MKLLRKYEDRYISSVAKYEVLAGADRFQLEYWESAFDTMVFLTLNDPSVYMARKIHRQLKQGRRSIDLADLFIAATSLANGLPLATLNRKHFEEIDGLELIVPE